MGKIVYIMGKSSTGKDTIFKQLLGDMDYQFNTIVSYTTRPIREGEKEGVEYHFTDEEGFLLLKKKGKVVEDRCYETVHGPWRYFTVADESINLSERNYITIGTLESYQKVRDYFGKEQVIPVLIELDDGIRLQRAINREMKEDHPKYEELCRRFLSDSVDFSDIKIKEAGISISFVNDNLEECIDRIKKYLNENI